ncbi:MAG: hypothetical protein HY257_10135, partial [Chloroflexi bacterium]|nr:hypothetical protein [Chloroflexota bacterium]
TVGRSVEIFYAQPVRVHSPYRTGHPDNLLIPLSGTFGETRSLFGGRGGDYWGGALRLKTTAGIRGAIENVACVR